MFRVGKIRLHPWRWREESRRLDRRRRHCVAPLFSRRYKGRRRANDRRRTQCHNHNRLGVGREKGEAKTHACNNDQTPEPIFVHAHCRNPSRTGRAVEGPTASHLVPLFYLPELGQQIRFTTRCNNLHGCRQERSGVSSLHERDASDSTFSRWLPPHWLLMWLPTFMHLDRAVQRRWW